jgi:hypothetical protein
MSLARIFLDKAFKNEAGKLSASKIATNGLLPGYFAVSEYGDKRAEGNGVISSAVSAAGDFALGFMSLPLYIASTMGPAAAQGAVSAYDSLSAYSRQLQSQKRNKPFQNATFVDSQQTYTMRQAGMNLARQGQMAAQQTSMGNEAASIAFMGR